MQGFFCLGNSRAGSAHNPSYAITFAFDNDFAALLPGTSSGAWQLNDFIQAIQNAVYAMWCDFRHAPILPYCFLQTDGPSDLRGHPGLVGMPGRISSLGNRVCFIRWIGGRIF
jgi:hypothetical protein